MNCVAVIKVKDATADEPAPIYKIVTGGVNGNIKVLDMEGQTTNEFNPYRPIPAPEGVVPATSSTYNLNGMTSLGAVGAWLPGNLHRSIDRSNRKMLQVLEGCFGFESIEGRGVVSSAVAVVDSDNNRPLGITAMRSQLSHPYYKYC